MWMRGKGLGNCARQLVKEIATVRSMDVVLPVREDSSSGHHVASCACGSSPVRIARWPSCWYRLGLDLPSTPKMVQNVVEKTAP